MSMMMAVAGECAAKCPPHAIFAVAGALVVGFVIGRLTKKGGAAAGEAKRKQQPKAERKPLDKAAPARQPIPAGSVEIYVGNLSYEMTDEELRKLFEKYGAVSTARIVLNRFNGKSKGFGFVVMPNRPEAEKAIEAYSEKEHMGRRMRVNEAKNTITEE